LIASFDMDQQFLFEDEPRRPPVVFELPGGGSITTAELKDLDEEKQIAVMRHWFHTNFADPVEETPYETAEGGYIYVYGGPYDPQEELEGKFGDIVPEEVIEKLADELTDISPNWTGHSRDLADDDYVFRTIAESPKYFETLKGSMELIRKLLEIRVEPQQQRHLWRLLHVSAITALETYLSDNFISHVTTDPALLRRFVETTPDFKNRKIALSDIFRTKDGIESEVKTFLIKLLWHRLAQVKQMYRDTLSVDFPSDTADLFRAIQVRHDLMHRGGKTEDGNERELNDVDIRQVVKAVEDFATWIEFQQGTF
jgi:hypothetical protein